VINEQASQLREEIKEALVSCHRNK
jgi:hypothetical protein